jgi:CVNH domain
MRFTAAFAFLAFTLNGANLAAAQPAGSYRATCDHIRQRGPFLMAECRSGGVWRHSELDLRGCVGSVANLNGRLVCAGGGYGHSGRGVWGDRPYYRD